MTEINKHAPSLGQKYGKNWLPRDERTYRLFTLWELSDYKAYPYAGGLLDQPNWILDDFESYMEITEYNELGKELERLEQRLVDLANNGK